MGVNDTLDLPELVSYSNLIAEWYPSQSHPLCRCLPWAGHQYSAERPDGTVVVLRLPSAADGENHFSASDGVALDGANSGLKRKPLDIRASSSDQGCGDDYIQRFRKLCIDMDRFPHLQVSLHDAELDDPDVRWLSARWGTRTGKSRRGDGGEQGRTTASPAQGCCECAHQLVASVHDVSETGVQGMHSRLNTRSGVARIHTVNKTVNKR